MDFEYDPETKRQNGEWHTALHSTNCDPIFCKDVLESLRKRIIRMRRDLTDKWMLHHGKAPSHTPLSQKFWPLKAFLSFPRLLMHLTSVRVTFSFIFKLNVLKRFHFETLENIVKSVTDMLKTIYRLNNSSAATKSENNIFISV